MTNATTTPSIEESLLSQLKAYRAQLTIALEGLRGMAAAAANSHGLSMQRRWDLHKAAGHRGNLTSCPTCCPNGGSGRR